MAQQTLNNLDARGIFRQKINENFTELYDAVDNISAWPLGGTETLTNPVIIDGASNALTFTNLGAFGVSYTSASFSGTLGTLISDSGGMFFTTGSLGTLDFNANGTSTLVLNGTIGQTVISGAAGAGNSGVIIGSSGGSNVSISATGSGADVVINATDDINLNPTDRILLKGVAASTPTTQFFRGNGTWAVPAQLDYDYVISTSDGTITATPRSGSSYSIISGSDAYTVIQGAITALTVSGGGAGTAGGSIYISAGTYSLTDELIITGWEGSEPFSSLTIRGAGNATVIRQSTASKHALIIKNNASVNLYDLRIEATGTARAAIYGDPTGTNEGSLSRSNWDNLFLLSESSSYAALYLVNVGDLIVGKLFVQNLSYHAMQIHNNSSVANYGNCKFGFIRALASDSSPYAGLALTSANSRMTNLISVDNFECDGFGYYGIATDYAAYCHFGFVDIENCTVGIGFGVLGSGANNNTFNFTVSSGYILPNTGGTGILCSEYTAANTFTGVWIDGDATMVPINDDSKFRNPNKYEVHYGFNVNPANVVITRPDDIYYSYTLNADPYTVNIDLPIGTQENSTIMQLQAMGSVVKATTIGIPYMESNVYAANLDSSGIEYVAVYLSKPSIITGVKTVMATQGDYTAGTYNGVGLYSVSGGTLTRVASSTNDGDIWKAASGTVITKAFSSAYNARAGLYYVSMQYQQSAQVVAPALYAYPPGHNIFRVLDFTNSKTLMAIAYNDSSFPTTKSTASDWNINDPMWVALY